MNLQLLNNVVVPNVFYLLLDQTEIMGCGWKDLLLTFDGSRFFTGFQSISLLKQDARHPSIALSNPTLCFWSSVTP